MSSKNTSSEYDANQGVGQGYILSRIGLISLIYI